MFWAARAKSRVDRRTKWHSWFAWRPVRIGGWWAWLITIERRGEEYADIDYGTGGWDWEYRLRKC
jgi:hypothetical protein